MNKYWIRNDIGQLLSKWLNTAVTNVIKEQLKNLQELQSTMKLSIIRIFLSLSCIQMADYVTWQLY
jgi:hypothetical protein